MKGRLKKIGNEYKLYAQDDSCIATSWHSPYQRLSKNNCQAIENGYDLDELLDGLLINRGEHPSRVRNPLYGEERQLAKDLVQKALEIIGDKKFGVNEVVELSNAMLKGNKAEQIDALGDIQVVLIILAEQLGFDLDTCLECAYNEIKNRKGKTLNGTFLKDETI